MNWHIGPSTPNRHGYEGRAGRKLWWQKFYLFSRPQTDTDTKAGLDENYGGRKFATLILGIDIEDEPYDDERSVFFWKNCIRDSRKESDNPFTTETESSPVYGSTPLFQKGLYLNRKP